VHAERRGIGDQHTSENTWAEKNRKGRSPIAGPRVVPNTKVKDLGMEVTQKKMLVHEKRLEEAKNGGDYWGKNGEDSIPKS